MDVRVLEDANYKGRVLNIGDLYNKYPDGGETNWYAYVTSERKYADWNTDDSQWNLRTGTSEDPNDTETNDNVNITVTNGEETYEIENPFFKGRVKTLNELYLKFPDGGETGWFAYVTSERDFAEWDTILRQWVLRGDSHSNGYVKYSEKQDLLAVEQKQARENIKAASTEDVTGIEGDVTNLSNQINELTSIVNAYSGKGGGVGHSDLGATPTQEELTKCAVGVIWPGYTSWVWNASNPSASTFEDSEGNEHTALEVFNATFVINDYNNHKWVLCNTPMTTPPVYQWIDMGVDSVGTATNTSLGIVKGSTKDGEVSINPDGTMKVNGYSAQMPIGIPYYSLRYNVPDNCRDMTKDNWLSMDEYAKCYEELEGAGMIWEKNFTTRQFKLPKVPAGGSLIAAGESPSGKIFEFGETGGSDVHTNTEEEMYPHDHNVVKNIGNGPYGNLGQDGKNTIKAGVTGLSGNRDYTLVGDTGDADAGKTSKTGGQIINNARVAKPYSIMNPYLVCRILIRVS